jgi:hypothetical protein
MRAVPPAVADGAAGGRLLRPPGGDRGATAIGVQTAAANRRGVVKYSWSM